LYEILNHRISEWKQELRKHHTSLWQALFSNKSRRSKSNGPIHDIMVQRLIVAYDLASAFAYMHERGYVILMNNTKQITVMC
jgi:DNA-binding helix-hairpin-helix protein with protein kinase domain